MLRYILVRIGQGVITCFILLTIVFMLTRLAGDPTIWLIDPKSTPEIRAQLEVKYGLSAPMLVQYKNYVVNILKGDFGTSFYYNIPAIDIIGQRVPATLELTLTGLLIAVLIGIPVGVYSAVKKGRVLDAVARGGAFLCISAPSFWVGIMLIYIFAIKANWLPAGGSKDGLYSLILPAFTVSLSLIGAFLRLTRSGMLEVLGTDYIKMARSKGIPERQIIWKHGLKNACIPVITMVMTQFVVVLSGDIAVENIFSWNGIGRLIMDSVFLRDYAVVQAFTILVGFAFIILSLLTDILYAYINPKIRYR